MDNRFIKTKNLLGDDFLNLASKKVFIAGLGGVGGTTFEALVRSGITHFVIVDKDDVDISNLNRQILYLDKDISKAKVEVAKARALAINPALIVEEYRRDVKDVLRNDVDLIIDCIDDVPSKVALIKYAVDNKIKIITSMGMANKVDPSLIRISSLNKSSVDPLAKKMRYELKKEGVNIEDITSIYSLETPCKDGAALNSLITVTSTAGLYIASYALNFLKRK